MAAHSLKAEAAHFALLRRLAPSLRHRLMGDLQPVTLLAELAERQVSRPAPNIEQIRDTIVKARQQSRAAVSSMMNVLAWVTREEDPQVTLKEGLDSCVDLLRTDSEVRGVRIVRGDFQDAGTTVNRRALRTITAAALAAAVDTKPPPSEIQLSCARAGECAVIRLELRFGHESAQEEFGTDARPLTWDDVSVLAQEDGVRIERSAPSAVQWRLPVS